MKRFLDIILIFAITFLLVNMFSWNNNKIEKKGVEITTLEKSYSTPAWVKLKITNNGTWVIDFNTCKNISILWPLGEKIKFPDIKCSDITLQAKKTEEIDYRRDYQSFNNIGNYRVELKLEDKKEFFTTFEIAYPGFFKKFFVGILYAPIYNLVVFLLTLFNNSFGWAIFSVTILIRLLLLYPQHKMMLSQRKLQAIQPKIKKIQEEFKGNQQMLGMKIMELYKKEKVNPFGSCGFLLIQMPILLVIYNIILGIQDYSNTYYIYNFLGNFHLESISYDFFWLELLKSWWIQWIILAILIAVIQFIQIKLSFSYNKNNEDKKDKVVLEKKKWEDSYSNMMPNAESLNKIMLYVMPLMVWVFTYTLFAWVWIYWGISTLFMLFQQLIVNKIIKK